MDFVPYYRGVKLNNENPNLIGSIFQSQHNIESHFPSKFMITLYNLHVTFRRGERRIQMKYILIVADLKMWIWIFFLYRISHFTSRHIFCRHIYWIIYCIVDIKDDEHSHRYGGKFSTTTYKPHAKKNIWIYRLRIRNQ